MRSKDKAFTLIELLIVIAIIGILAAIAVPIFSDAQLRAMLARTVSDLRSLEVALEMYHTDNRVYPHRQLWLVDEQQLFYFPTQMRLRRLTTPTAYIAELPSDPFIDPKFENLKQLLSVYHSSDGTYGWTYNYWNKAPRHYHSHACLWGHKWRLYSWGPNRIDDWIGCEWSPWKPGLCPNQRSLVYQYRASNGLRSLGNVIQVGPIDEGASPAGASNLYRPVQADYCSIPRGI